MGASRRLLAGSEGVMHGPFRIGKPATHMGKINYPQSRHGVFPPSDWDPATAERSAQPPGVSLCLQFVHGYEGARATGPNVFFSASGELVYFAAAVGVVYNRRANTQRFFLGHNDDIVCLGLHPIRTLAASGQVRHCKHAYYTLQIEYQVLVTRGVGWLPEQRFHVHGLLALCQVNTDPPAPGIP